MKVGVLLSTIAVFAVAAVPRADAQHPGIRIGLTDDLDSFFFGGHLRFPDIAGVQSLMVEPSLDLGFGEEGFAGFEVNYFTLRLTGNLKYVIPVGGGGATAFPLVGLSVYYVSIDDCDGDCDDTEVGLNLGGGFDYRGFGVELWLGIEDIPDLTVLGTYTF